MPLIVRSTRVIDVGAGPGEEAGPVRALLATLDGPRREHMHAAPGPRATVHINQPDLLTNNPEDGGRGAAGEAIRAARAGSLPTQQMLQAVLAAQVIVPLADPPVMDGARMLSWKPATVSRDADGAQFIVVFTDEELDAKYAKWRPEYSYRLRVGADWLIAVLPAGHGIVFNLGGGEIMFEWPAPGIQAYRADHTT